MALGPDRVSHSDQPRLPAAGTDLLATGAIALTLTLGLFLVQVITSVLRREPAGLGRAAKGLLIALVMSVFAFSVTKILLGVVDQLSEGVVSYTIGTDIAGLGKRLPAARALTLRRFDMTTGSRSSWQPAGSS